MNKQCGVIGPKILSSILYIYISKLQYILHRVYTLKIDWIQHIHHDNPQYMAI